MVHRPKAITISPAGNHRSVHMAKRSLRERMMRGTAGLLLGGSLLQVSGCDPLVRQTLLTGLETTASTLAQTFITAFFVGLEDEGTGTLTTTP
jgi:hypothetical protein